ncbi:hypothetical protein MBAV_004721 [Candidatus Magnetobacterium bavaricum]|uniref:Uncharacterized protein n=1 Tax=Candidatus Magnetobacterium bavaricum TaxID=29290 RepID=A0A0F3GM77_9BACT|nr:hypothetical protein MBAV_004721 [Candidatus Magnetobacterium bavaricum]
MDSRFRGNDSEWRLWPVHACPWLEQGVIPQPAPILNRGKQESRSLPLGLNRGYKNVVAIKSINGYGSSSCKSLNPLNQGSDNLQKGMWCAMR